MTGALTTSFGKIRLVVCYPFLNVTLTVILFCQLAVFRYKNSDWMSVTHVVTSPSEGWDGETGRISEEILRKYVDGDNKTWVGLCGPPGFNREAVRLLRDVSQLETEHIHVFEG